MCVCVADYLLMYTRTTQLKPLVWFFFFTSFYCCYLYLILLLLFSCGMFCCCFARFSLLDAYFVSIISRTHSQFTIDRRTRINISFVCLFGLFVFLFYLISISVSLYLLPFISLLVKVLRVELQSTLIKSRSQCDFFYSQLFIKHTRAHRERESTWTMVRIIKTHIYTYITRQ